MEPGGILLCAVERDERAPEVVDAARRWAEATSLRPLFVHICDDASESDGQAIERAQAALMRLHVARDELWISTGAPAALLPRVIDAVDPALVLLASCSRDTAADSLPGRVCGAVMRET